MFGGIGSAISGAIGGGGAGGTGMQQQRLRQMMQQRRASPGGFFGAQGMPQPDGRTAVPRPPGVTDTASPNGTQAGQNAYTGYKYGDAAHAEDALDQYTEGMGKIGSEGSAIGYQRTRDFDPNAALQTYAKGAWNSAVTGQGGLNDQLMKLREGAAASGRLDSGFFDEDQGGVVRQVTNDFSNQITGQALNTAQMQQNNNAALYGIGRDANDQYTEGLSARIQERRDKSAAKKQRRAGIGSAIGGIIGGIGGSFLGPMGAGLGAKLGAGIGGAVSS